MVPRSRSTRAHRLVLQAVRKLFDRRVEANLKHSALPKAIAQP